MSGRPARPGCTVEPEPVAWRIHSWSAATMTGEVVSPHFGPLRFGPEQNPNGTHDFTVSEEVLVQLDGVKGNYKVRSVVRARDRAATNVEGTACDVFARLNAARHGDMTIEESAGSMLRIWVGDCCAWCGDSWLVTFTGVSTLRGLDEDMYAYDPWFRFASTEELHEQDLPVPLGSRAYRIVLTHEADASPSHDIFVVAEGVGVEPRRSARESAR